MFVFFSSLATTKGLALVCALFSGLRPSNEMENSFFGLSGGVVLLHHENLLCACVLALLVR